MNVTSFRNSLPTARPSRFAALMLPLALATTWLVWGSTFLAIHITITDLPPLLMMGARFVAAGAIVVAIAALRRHAMPSLREWRDAAIVGGGLVTIGMGATSWSSQHVATGVEALLVASASLWMTGLARIVHGARLAAVSVVGLCIGFAGLAALVLPGLLGGAHSGVPAVPALVLISSTLAWAAASLFAPRAARPQSSVLATGMQMLCGGVMLSALAILHGDLGNLDLAGVGPSAAGAWGYLVAFGSLGAFLAYGWLLQNASPVLASTYAFVNPVVAILLGALLLGEGFSAVTALATGLVLVAVVCILVGDARSTRSIAADLPGATQHAPAERAARRAPRGGGSRPRPALGLTGLDGWLPSSAPLPARRMAQHRSSTLGDGMDAQAIDSAFDHPARRM